MSRDVDFSSDDNWVKSFSIFHESLAGRETVESVEDSKLLILTIEIRDMSSVAQMPCGLLYL